MQNLILGMINKSIGNTNYHLHNIEELLNILQKENLTTLEKYYLKELFSIPFPILQEKLLKNLDENKKVLLTKKAKQLGIYNENTKRIFNSF